ADISIATAKFGTGEDGDLEGMACNGGSSQVKKQDFGDAPNEYPHVSHKISPKLYLGDSKPDRESDQQSSLNATGDGADDNDGVKNLPTLIIGSSSYTVPVKVYNHTGQDAYITAWIDFNRNRKLEFREALNVNDLKVHSSNSSQTVNITWDNNFSSNQFSNLTSGKNIMRIRISTSRILRCDSEHYSNNEDYSDNYFVSPDGEVEDYEITIEKKDNGIRGRFNIQRTNTPKDSKDFRLYTQIVGRDFNYHIVFYDENITKEQALEKVPLKIDIKDMDTHEVLYTTYRYYSLLRSRVLVLDNDDLDHIKASKRALFTISYAISPNGSILQTDCSNSPTIKECYQTLNSNNLTRTDEAKDIFAIRPETFFVTISDGDKER
ncbi:MAG: hypothetical protein KAU90_07765, partial [Sulfurovaceae bacterium]|nr:hypothetical protein [Sulfurovaceae bacterium]